MWYYHLIWLIPLTWVAILVALQQKPITMKSPPAPATSTTGAPSTKTTDSSTKSSRIGVWGWRIAGTLAILGITILLIGMASCSYKVYKWAKAPSSVNSAAAHPPAQTTQKQGVEALVLMHECMTPCSANIQWKAKIRTNGHPLKIKFQGVNEWFEHPGEEYSKAPPDADIGETKFISADKEHPNIRVQVYKRIIVQGG